MTDTLVWRRPAEPATNDPLYAAVRLAEELRNLEMPADIHHGVGIALVSVWIDLVVWTNGVSYHWWSGKTSARGRRRYVYSPVDDPLTAARRVAVRYTDLRNGHPLSEVVEETQCVLPDDRRPVDLRGRRLAAPVWPE